MTRISLITFALASLGVACAGREGGERNATPALPDSIVVDAINEHFYDARVHVVYDGGQRRSLGTIAGNGGRAQTKVNWEPHALIFEISFIIDGAAYVTYPQDVAPGQFVQLRLPPNIGASGLFRRLTRS